jgi:hypothetical protein
MYPVLLDEAAGAVPLDEREGIDREGRVLTYELVHRCLERPARAARRHVLLMRRRG